MKCALLAYSIYLPLAVDVNPNENGNMLSADESDLAGIKIVERGNMDGKNDFDVEACEAKNRESARSEFYSDSDAAVEKETLSSGDDTTNEAGGEL